MKQMKYTIIFLKRKFKINELITKMVKKIEIICNDENNKSSFDDFIKFLIINCDLTKNSLIAEKMILESEQNKCQEE